MRGVDGEILLDLFVNKTLIDLILQKVWAIPKRDISKNR
jgi:hypothetical protein